MDTDLLTVARQLAERGWLPGVYAYGDNIVVAVPGSRLDLRQDATEADLHLAAHR